MNGTASEHDRHDAELIAGLVTGGLEPGERRVAEALVRRCAGCRALRDGYAAGWDRIGSGTAALPPADLRRRIIARLPAAPPSRWSLKRLFVPVRTRALVAVALALVLPIASLGLSGAFAPRPAFASTTTLTVISGTVESSEDGRTWSPAPDGLVLAAGAHVRTSADGRGVVTFFDGSLITLDAQSTVEIRELAAGPGVVISLFQTLGRTWSSVHRAATGTRYEVRTPSATATVRGTGFETTVTTSGTTTVATSDGVVAVAGATSTVLVGASQRTTVEPGAAPATPATIPPRGALRLRATVPLLGVDPSGLACGLTPDGGVVRQSPRCLVAPDGAVTFLDPASGGYRVVVRSDLATTALVSALTSTADRTTSESSASVALGAGEQAVATLVVRATDGSASDATFAAFALTATSPAKLAARATPGPVAAPVLPTAATRPTGTPAALRTAGAVAPGGSPEPARTPETSAAPSPTPAATSTPVPTPTAVPTRTAEPTPEPTPRPTPNDTAAPSVTVRAPAGVAATTPQTIAITATVSDAGSGVLDEPEATADVRGSGMSRLFSTWDPATGAFSASFVIDRVDGPIVFTVRAKDRAGNVGTGTATTLPAGVAAPTPTPTPTPSVTPSPTPSPTSSPSPTPSPTPVAVDATAPAVTVSAPATLPAVPQDVTITAQVSDTGSGVSDAPTADANVNGSGMSLRSSSWDAATGRYTAVFAIDRTDGPIVFTVRAKDRSGNEGAGSATTQLQ